MTSLQLAYYRDLETKRHNIVLEEETIRHNAEQEKIGYRQAAAAAAQAYASQRQAEVSYLRYEMDNLTSITQRYLNTANARNTRATAAYTEARTALAAWDSRIKEQELRQAELKTQLDYQYANYERYYNVLNSSANYSSTVTRTKAEVVRTAADAAKAVANTVQGIFSVAGAIA